MIYSSSPTRSVSSCNRAEIGLHARACLDERDRRPCAPTTAAPILAEAVMFINGIWWICCDVLLGDLMWSFNNISCNLLWCVVIWSYLIKLMVNYIVLSHIWKYNMLLSDMRYYVNILVSGRIRLIWFLQVLRT